MGGLAFADKISDSDSVLCAGEGLAVSAVLAAVCCGSQSEAEPGSQAACDGPSQVVGCQDWDQRAA